MKPGSRGFDSLLQGHDGVPKRIRELAATQLFAGSNPAAVSTHAVVAQW